MELFKRIHTSCEADFDQPLVAYLKAREEGRVTAPYIPQWQNAPLHLLCRKALSWHAAGFEKEAAELRNFILKYEKFPTLWCPEKDFKEEELLHLLSLVKKLDLATVEEVPDGADFQKSEAFDAAFVSSGFNSSLGAILSEGFEVRSFGPQALPLGDAALFGISGSAIEDWVCCFARPEVWFETKYEVSGKECKINLNFVGVAPEEPLGFSFYIKALSCSIGNEVFKPKTLARFQGEGKKVSFGKVELESSISHKIQIIPLAGSGGFWNADFLVAFEIHPLQPRVSFSLQALSS